ncbi:MAG: BPTI/Kunitz-type proteinase inhibitor domain-containing protein [Candidatus Diapherotrites archaeon]
MRIFFCLVFLILLSGFIFADAPIPKSETIVISGLQNDSMLNAQYFDYFNEFVYGSFNSKAKSGLDFAWRKTTVNQNGLFVVTLSHGQNSSFNLLAQNSCNQNLCDLQKMRGYDYCIFNAVPGEYYFGVQGSGQYYLDVDFSPNAKVNSQTANECQSVTCFNNAECNDFNSDTEDVCVNPGAVDSYCSNEEINSCVIVGDVDGDSVVDSVDVQLVVNMALGIESLENYPCADFDLDGKITAVDVQSVLNAVLGITSESFNPKESTLELEKNETKVFSVSLENNPWVNISTEWFLNDNKVSSESEFVFDSQEIGSGSHDLMSVVKGDDPLLSHENVWKILVSGIACELAPDSGACKAYIPKYYYNSELNSCRRFIWGGCGGVIPFHTLDSCQQTCELN